MKKLKLPLILLVLICTEVLFSQTINFKIIETTDTHGQIYPYDFTNAKPVKNSLAQVMTYVDQERDKADQSVILLSGGDILQGTPAVYYYNFEDTTSTHLYADVMNYMHYDAGTVGNHDIETGHKVYDRFVEQLDFPWLAANALNTNTGQPYFNPYAIIEKEGIKIAVLGLITPYIPHWLPQNIWSGIEFEDMIESARKWIEIIKEREKPDLIIGLFHSGINYMYGEQDGNTYKNENASQLVAEQVDGFDVVFVGHDHHGWNKTVTNVKGKNVLILGGTSYARDISVANITLNYDSVTKNWNKNISGQLVAIEDFEPEKEFMNTFAVQFEDVQDYDSKQIGEITEPISTRESIFGNSSFSDLIHTIQLELTKADVSFTAPLSLDTQIDKGTVYVKDMFKLYRYENLLYTMNLSGQEIKDYLEYSYGNWFNQMADENDHLLIFEKDENGEVAISSERKNARLKNQYYNFDSALGIDYSVDVSLPAGSRINITSMTDGSPFILDKFYKVAVNSYRGNGGGSHLTNGAGIPVNELSKRVINSTEKDLRFYLMKWIENKKVVEPKAGGNWEIIPQDWWLKGMETDFYLLFPKK